MNENLDPSSENLSSNEREFENNLRPVSFEDFSGQDLTERDFTKTIMKQCNFNQANLRGVSLFAGFAEHTQLEQYIRCRCAGLEPVFYSAALRLHRSQDPFWKVYT